jgi:hypothetical protein
MPEEIRHPDGRIEHPGVRHEPTDASLRWVAGTVIVASVLGIIIHFVVLVLFHGLNEEFAEERKSRFSLAPTPSQSLPPEPRLEQLDRLTGDERSNLHLRQKEKLDILNSYGPADDKGFVHIPIERAMRLLANKLPARDEKLALRSAAASMIAGLLGCPGPAPLTAAVALFPGSDRALQDSVGWRQNGLVNGGESNSGRLFNRRKPRWLER